VSKEEKGGAAHHVAGEGDQSVQFLHEGLLQLDCVERLQVGGHVSQKVGAVVARTTVTHYDFVEQRDQVFQKLRVGNFVPVIVLEELTRSQSEQVIGGECCWPELALDGEQCAVMAGIPRKSHSRAKSHLLLCEVNSLVLQATVTAKTSLASEFKGLTIVKGGL